MTRESPKMPMDEVIDTLKSLVFGSSFNRTTAKEREALDTAISALQAQDSPKPIAESVQNVQNEDLISRKAAIDTVSQALKRTFVEYEDIARTIIGKLPSVEPEPLSDAYTKAVWTWLLDYQIKVAKLKGRYTPYEVLSWVANDWRKEHE